MKKKLSLTLLVGALSCLCLGAASCAEKTTVEEWQEKGYTISVSYNANGGSFLNRPGITVMDMFNPADYEDTKDAEGAVHIKLTEPTNPQRPTSSSDSITLTLQNHFFAGWYQTRELKLVNGSPVDANGRALTEQEDGTYVYTDTLTSEKPTVGLPSYNYSGYWDFEQDTIAYKEGDGKVEMTLYAGWVPYYEFHYYYQNNGVWEQLTNVTSFDYKTTNVEGSKTFDHDTIWLPQWKDGAMNYEYTYANKNPFKFPKVTGKTFEKAYTDEACTQEIAETLEHHGVLLLSEGESKALVVENRIQNVYITLSEGEQYHIDTAEQLVKYANADGYYEINGDLEFNAETAWPTAFSGGVFTGKMYGKDGAKITMKNIVANYAVDRDYGGLFGKVAKSAVIDNITFENVTVDFSFIGNRNHGAQFGLFAGVIEEGATVKNVAIDGLMRIGAIGNANDLAFHLVANGVTEGITTGEIRLQLYGTRLIDVYQYTIKPETMKVAEDGTIEFEFYPSSGKLDKEFYDIQYTEVE